MGNVNMEAEQVHYRNNSKPSAHTVAAALDRLFTKSDSNAQDIIDLTEAMIAKADKIDIAPPFSEETAYYIGDLVYQSGRLWKFTVDHTPGEWNQEEVSATNIDTAIKESGGGGGSAGDNYSTTEQEIGTWIDGKKLYQKTYALRVNGVDQYPYAGQAYTLPDTFDYVFMKHAEGIRTSDAGSYVDTMSWAGEFLLVPSRGGLVASQFSSRYNSIYITLCYTKRSE